MADDKNKRTTDAPRLLQKIRDEIGPEMMKEFGYSSVMQIPRLDKVVVNIGLGEALQNARAIENVTSDLGRITGQRPVTTKAKKSIAGFKIREGMPIGAMVTMRGRRMYEFVDRMVNIALPRVKDFRGLKDDSCDRFGNFSFGIKEHIIFPEINFDKVDRIRGMDITLVTTGNDKKLTLALLESINFPFIKKKEKRDDKKNHWK